MKKTLRVVAVVAALLAVSLLGLKTAVYGYALREQHRAEGLLAAIVRLQPGVSPVADVSQTVVDPQFASLCRDNTTDAEFINLPDWKLFDNEHTPEWLRDFEGKWILPRWTMFSVHSRCESGLLVQLRISEMQASPEWPHGFANVTEVLPSGEPANGGAAEQRSQDRAYWVYERGTSVYAGDKLDKLVRESPTLNRFIFVTPQATDDERRRALDFKLDCFTRLRGCQDVDRILTPAPKRP